MKLPVCKKHQVLLLTGKKVYSSVSLQKMSQRIALWHARALECEASPLKISFSSNMVC